MTSSEVSTNFFARMQLVF